MNLANTVGLTHKERGPAVTDLQRALLRLGYYGIRFALDGDYGRNTLGAVLACKYDLVRVYGVARKDLQYAPRAGNPGSLSASGEVTRVFADCLQTLVAGGTLRGVEAWRTPARDEVADADLKVREFLLAEAARTAFPAQLLWTIFGVESGANHFDHFGHVKFGIDWRGRNYGETVNFSVEGAAEPWVRSRGWGLTQYTPTNVSALPRPMPAYISSVGANLRTAIRLFVHKFTAFSKRRPCSFPTAAAASYDCRTCLRSKGFDPVTYSDAVQQPCSWLKAVWAYNGVTPAGRRYMEHVVRNIIR
ncbi:MAG: peptidoglycan-binding domain-containing protein [Armatimonadota bacterium]|nr:peptidoglycan-binding domain-containing protein [Armatimonadota bacterium]